MTNKNTKEKDVIDQILDQLDLHDMTQEELFGAAGLAKKLTSRLLNKALEAEMDTHITYGYHVPPPVITDAMYAGKSEKLSQAKRNVRSLNRVSFFRILLIFASICSSVDLLISIKSSKAADV